jgi:hypothetical protein
MSQNMTVNNLRSALRSRSAADSVEADAEARRVPQWLQNRASGAASDPHDPHVMTVPSLVCALTRCIMLPDTRV